MVVVLYSESVEQIPLRWRPAWRQYHRFSQCGLLVQVGEYLVDDQGIFDTYMDPSRFARHRFNRDKKKVAAIYPAC